MSLTPIAETFGLIALVFIAAGAASLRWADRGWGIGVRVSTPSAFPLAWGAALRAAWLPAAAEALVLTLIAALWFGSLGSGGWVLLFLLLGALAGGADRWIGRRLAGTPAKGQLWLFVAALLRYLAAGALCAWRLS